MDRMNFTDAEKTKRLPDLWMGKLTDFCPSVHLKNRYSDAESYIEQEYNKKLINEFNETAASFVMCSEGMVSHS